MLVYTCLIESSCTNCNKMSNKTEKFPFEKWICNFCLKKIDHLSRLHGLKHVVIQIISVWFSCFVIIYRSFRVASITCRTSIPFLTWTYWLELKLIFCVDMCFIMHEIRDRNTDRLGIRLPNEFYVGYYQTSCMLSNTRMHGTFNIMSITSIVPQHESKLRQVGRNLRVCLDLITSFFYEDYRLIT